MKTLPSGLQTLLDSRYTTLAWCWKVTRTDGIILGFTDHDKDLTFGGDTYEAASGFTASEMAEGLGLSVDNLEAEGALSSDSITELDLAQGLYDNAEVEIYRVDWTNTDNRILIRKGNLGEVTTNDGTFMAEVRGLAHKLNQPQGRVYQNQCDAKLGDSRCGVDLTDAQFLGFGQVEAIIATNKFTASGLTGFVDGLFSNGVLTWTSGSGNQSASVEIKQFDAASGGSDATITLWLSPLFSLTSGDQFTVVAGCDKLFSTCRDQFNNKDNFRGFPHIPGGDYVLTYPKQNDSSQDGAAMPHKVSLT